MIEIHLFASSAAAAEETIAAIQGGLEQSGIGLPRLSIDPLADGSLEICLGFEAGDADVIERICRPIEAAAQVGGRDRAAGSAGQGGASRP